MVKGAHSDGLDFNKVDSVVGDVLGGLWFKFMSIFVLAFIDDVQLMMAAVIDMDRI